jgi:putative PIN family toxin of toxin-antitoxin system
MKAESAWPVVIDTNVWISAFLMKTGAPADLVRLVLAQGQPVFSAVTFDELDARLWRPKFDRYLDIDQRKQLLRDANSLACWIIVPPTIAAQTFCRDADDDKMIHAALAAKATLLVTGDDDLLCLHPLGDLDILTPRVALEKFKGRRGQ